MVSFKHSAILITAFVVAGALAAPTSDGREVAGLLVSSLPPKQGHKRTL